jgi:hypothetical protein
VNDLPASLSFWQGLLGIAFGRPDKGFACREHPEGHQIMLRRRHGRFETGRPELPPGQGAMFQSYLDGLAPVLAALAARSWPIYPAERPIQEQGHP